MTSSTKISDYPNLVDPTRMKGVSQSNAEHLKRYITSRRLVGAGLYTISIDAYRIASWMRIIDVDNAADWTADDIKLAYLNRLDDVSNGNASGVTLDGDLRAIKIFWRFLNPDKPPIDIRKPRTKVHLLSQNIVSQKQILSMKNAAEAAGDLRASALIMTVYGTGCRISELLDANICDVDIGRQFAKIKVEGKTGFRLVPFVTGLPELQSWINHHPVKKPDSPLFVTYNTRGHGNRRLNKKTAEGIFDKYAVAAGIPPDIKSNPHAIRHRAASEDDRFMTHQEMCLKYGWSPDSDMPKRYTHSDLEELQNTILQIAGVESQEEVEDTQTVVQCPRCKAINKATARYCSECSLVLDKNFGGMYSDVIADLNDRDILSKLLGAKSEKNKFQGV